MTSAVDGNPRDHLLDTVRRELYTPVIGDVLDTLGRYHQFLPAPIRALTPGAVLVGRAMPALMADVHGPQQRPFGLLTEALDQLEPGDIYLCGGGSRNCAYWGEILTATARTRGAVGAVIDGYHRDTPKVLEQRWPVFSRGSYGQDSAVRTQVIDYRVPIQIGHVWVNPGDLIVGDVDGIVVVPQDLEADVVTQALAKARTENTVRRAIEDGMTSTAAFAEYGVL
ncbi:RraA family protein (plasmid) [Embleya sp. NBC_00888]|uniref:RraA family protein n=1 Tax=Embleya sp. NBC_00888 TaxID=2975960 RepID=UPI002F912C3C|nr:RraA family protein [Embleya sp. NBC_00888]